MSRCSCVFIVSFSGALCNSGRCLVTTISCSLHHRQPEREKVRLAKERERFPSVVSCISFKESTVRAYVSALSLPASRFRRMLPGVIASRLRNPLPVGCWSELPRLRHQAGRGHWFRRTRVPRKRSRTEATITTAGRLATLLLFSTLLVRGSGEGSRWLGGRKLGMSFNVPSML